MKAVFGINVTEDKKSDKVDGEVFISERVPEAQSQSLTKEDENFQELKKRAGLPPALTIVYYICTFISLCGIAGIIRSLGKLSFAKMYSNAPVIFILLGICIPICLILFIYKKARTSSVVKSEDFQNTVNHLKSQVDQAFATLRVPSDAKVIDILLYKYKQKGNEISVKSLGMTNYINMQMNVYKTEEFLCFTDIEAKYSIPLECISKIKTINKRISVPAWNKDIPFNKDEYKQYKMTSNQFDNIFFKPYYSIEIHYKGEEYELLIPPYELPVIRELIGTVPIE